MIELSMSGVVQGHAKITINDEDPAGRQELSVQVLNLLKDKHAVFVHVKDGDQEEDVRITGYDPETNEWILAKRAPGNSKRQRRPAAGSSASSVGQVSGGAL